MSKTGRYSRVPELTAEYLDGRTCIAVGPGSWIILEGTGVALWEVLAEPGSPFELARRLSGAFSGPVAAIEDDVTAALAEWERHGLVRLDDRVA